MKRYYVAGSVCVVVILLPFADCNAGEKKVVQSGGDYLVKRYQDISYYKGKDAHPTRHKLDVIVPRGKKNFPVVFFVHGGAWTFGSKDIQAGNGRRFAQNGIGCVLVNYRLAPTFKHPTQIEDVAMAFDWTVKNIKKYGGRPDRIFLCGHSAGGHLVALLALNEKYLQAHKLSRKNIRAVIPVSGVYSIPPEGEFLRVFPNAKACYDASPINHVSKNVPPFFSVYSDKDIPTFDEQAQDLCKKLMGLGNKASFFEAENTDHNTIIFIMASQESEVFQRVLSFIARHSEIKLKQIK